MQLAPERPIDDPMSVDYSARDMAGHKMVEWFSEVDRALSESENALGGMLASKGVKEVPVRRY